MKLLIVTQKVNKNDQILGFFHQWLLEFVKNVDQLTIICLEEGLHDLYGKAEVLSLGKENGVGKIGRVWRLFNYVLNKKDQYDIVLVHMNPIYLVLAGFLWKKLGKKMYLWYMHKTVDLKLKIAEKYVEKIFTASEESLRLDTPKKVLTGHGIDTEVFKPKDQVSGVSDQGQMRAQKKLLTVGRVSRVKRIDLLIEALPFMPGIVLEIVGGPVTEDDTIFVESLKKRASELNVAEQINWVGPVLNTETVTYYHDADVFINVSETGSLDKALLEALACETPVVSSSDSAGGLVGVSVITPEPKVIADAVQKALTETGSEQARQAVMEKHGLTRLIKKLVGEMSR